MQFVKRTSFDARSQCEHGARRIFQEFGEVFRAERLPHLADISFPKQVFANLSDRVGDEFIVHQRQTTEQEVQLVVAAKYFGDLEHALHFVADLLLRFERRESQCAFHLQFIGDDIFRNAAMDRANADDGRFEGIQPAGCDGVQAHDDMRQKHIRINCCMRIRPMPADTFDRRSPSIHAAAARTFIDGNGAHWLTWVHVLGNDIVHAFHCTFIVHAHRAALAFFICGFFGGLEQEAHASTEFFLCKKLCRA